MGKKLDLTGQRFGRLVVVRRAEKPPGIKDRHPRWLCICDCGNQKVVASDKLLVGYTSSCGCLKLEKDTERIKKCGKPHVTHGQSEHRLYCTYSHMKDRCYNESNSNYKNYGGRGISVCEEWLNSFQAFYDWAMSNGYTEDLTIDRIDNDGNYCPDNCRLISNTAQQYNKRTNRMVMFNGVSVTLTELSKITGVHVATLSWRVNHGWEDDKVATPVRNKRRQ